MAHSKGPYAKNVPGNVCYWLRIWKERIDLRPKNEGNVRGYCRERRTVFMLNPEECGDIIALMESHKSMPNPCTFKRLLYS